MSRKSLSKLSEAFRATVEQFNGHPRCDGFKLEDHDEDGHYAILLNFDAHPDVLPSLDFRPHSGIDTSFWFERKGGRGRDFDNLCPKLKEMLEVEFPDKVSVCPRGGTGTSVVVRTYTADEARARLGSPDSVADEVCRQFERMLGVGLEIFAAIDAGKQSAKQHDADLMRRVQKAVADEVEERRERLKRRAENALPPKRVVVLASAFERDPDVIAETLHQAQGRCGDCGQHAPFERVRGQVGAPFLEVHHKTPLSEGGLDILDNVVALCPNCHRNRHHGPRSRSALDD